VGLSNYIRLPASNGRILVFSACCYTATVQTIAASLHESPLAIESLLYSLLQSLLESLLENRLESLLERAAIRKE
jgi:hypothetical protein